MFASLATLACEIKGHKEALFEWSGQEVGLAMGVVISKGTRNFFEWLGQHGCGVTSHMLRERNDSTLHDIFIFLIFIFSIEFSIDLEGNISLKSSCPH